MKSSLLKKFHMAVQAGALFWHVIGRQEKLTFPACLHPIFYHKNRRMSIKSDLNMVKIL